jgi:hypothetical protein
MDELREIRDVELYELLCVVDRSLRDLGVAGLLDGRRVVDALLDIRQQLKRVIDVDGPYGPWG